MNRTDKQILRSRAFRARAQDDKRERAFEKKGRRTDGFFSFSFHAASEAVILSAEGAKDLLLGIVND
jgi:hypothetical protein